MRGKKSLKHILNIKNSYLVVSHDSPDGDAIGSVLAFGKALENLNKEYRVYIGDNIPDKYIFLHGADKIITSEDNIDIIPQVTLALDCGDLNRLKLENEIYLNFIITIDHHVSNNYFGHINIVDPKACATGEILYNLFKNLDIKIDIDMASALYTAILTDTGCFRFSNTTPNSHIIASELIKKGVSVQKITREIYEKRSIENLKILGKALDNLQVSDNGKYAWSFITREMIRETNAKESDLEGIINYIREINGVEVGILFNETSNSSVKVGFRSNEFVDVSELANYFSGGGHKRAAGCKISGRLDDVADLVIKKIENIFKSKGD